MNGTSAEAAHNQRPHLGDALEIAVDVDDAEPVVERRAGDEQIRDRRAVPHPVVMGTQRPPYTSKRSRGL